MSEVTLEEALNHLRAVMLEHMDEDIFVTHKEQLADRAATAIMNGEEIGPELSQLLYERLK